MLPSYFDYIFVHLRQKERLRTELSPKFLSTLVPNPTQKARPDLQLWFSLFSFNNLFFQDGHGRVRTYNLYEKRLVEARS